MVVVVRHCLTGAVLLAQQLAAIGASCVAFGLECVTECL